MELTDEELCELSVVGDDERAHLESPYGQLVGDIAGLRLFLVYFREFGVLGTVVRSLQHRASSYSPDV